MANDKTDTHIPPTHDPKQPGPYLPRFNLDGNPAPPTFGSRDHDKSVIDKPHLIAAEELAAAIGNTCITQSHTSEFHDPLTPAAMSDILDFARTEVGKINEGPASVRVALSDTIDRINGGEDVSDISSLNSILASPVITVPCHDINLKAGKSRI